LTPQDNSDFQLHAFVSKGMASLLGAADVVVTRAGATTILELAALAKPTILIPNGKLTGGHQLKNASVYTRAGAVYVVYENDLLDDPLVLVQHIKHALTHRDETRHMTKTFSSFARPQAARDMADMILSAIK
jgi:UDP-N-acetylglucosamine--N-acetylmuramyl-(pentapeptide) pyrophosphoryl-undecaprenol N-acetylglucosamine transferase